MPSHASVSRHWALPLAAGPFEISPRVLNIGPVKDDSPDCYSGIIAADLPASYWIVGNVFLQGVYSVFDYGTRQVGFADLVVSMS